MHIENTDCNTLTNVIKLLHLHIAFHNEFHLLLTSYTHLMTLVKASVI